MFWERELNVGELQSEFAIRCESDLREEICCENEQGETGKVEIWKTGTRNQ